MGKGKRRQTAKTGDRGLAKQAAAEAASLAKRQRDNDDDDPIYSKVDRFHNDKDQDFMALEQVDREDEEEDFLKEETIMDLGVRDSDDDSDDDDDDDEDDSDNSEEDGSLAEEDDNEDLHGLDDDEDDDDDDESDSPNARNKMDLRNWGRKYYHGGDTADLEIGQELDDAVVEEEAAKEVQKARLEQMSEDDYLLSDDDDDDGVDDDEAKDDPDSVSALGKASRKMQKTIRTAQLSKAELRMRLDRQHPEWLPLLSHFSSVVQDLQRKTSVATTALLEDPDTARAIGATIQGQKYLVTRALVQSSTALNLCMYLLLKHEEESMTPSGSSTAIQSHPVMTRLHQMNQFLEKLHNIEERQKKQHGKQKKHSDLNEQLEHLVRAAAMVQAGEVEAESDDDDSDDGSNNNVSETEENDPTGLNTEIDDTKDSAVAAVSSEDDEDESMDAEALNRQILNEARFGLRPQEVDSKAKPSGRKRRRAAADLADFDDEGEENDAETNRKTKASVLASTLNAVEQRRQTSHKRRAAPSHQTDDLDDLHTDTNKDTTESAIRRSLEMMEADVGPLDDIDDGDDNSIDIELEDDNDFYQQVASKSKARKDARAAKYAVAPKFPRTEKEVEGERAASKTIIKNRGLVAHKSKKNRNGRVKKRIQYAGALKKRKGGVREVAGNKDIQVLRYGGEETDIKANLSRSRKLAK